MGLARWVISGELLPNFLAYPPPPPLACVKKTFVVIFIFHFGFSFFPSPQLSQKHVWFLLVFFFWAAFLLAPLSSITADVLLC